MAHNYKIGEYTVSLSYGGVSALRVYGPDKVSNKPGIISSTVVVKFQDYEDAAEMQFWLNSWGLNKRTIGTSQVDYLQAGIRAIKRQSTFSHEIDMVERYDSTPADYRKKRIDEMMKLRRANYELFKELLSKIENVSEKNLLKSIWILYYNYSYDKISKDEYNEQFDEIDKQLKELPNFKKVRLWTIR